MKIAVVGMGYVGLSNAIMLSANNEVSILEINEEKIINFNKGESPIDEPLIKSFVHNQSTKINATNNPVTAFKDAEYILICTPTNFNEKNKSFDTSSIESTLEKIQNLGFEGCVVIRSTVPIGFTKNLNEKYSGFDIAFFPEFLREGSALEDCLNPSRIICGSSSRLAKKFLKILLDSTTKKTVGTLVTNATEAESIKLFSNTYLAMRIAFFNELDTFSHHNALNSKEIIQGVCMDERIGDHYNNPSFGYGGYCLPKDTKQLVTDFSFIPQKLITATVRSNQTRKKYLSTFLSQHPAKVIGIFKISMKMGSDNFRKSSQLDLIKFLKKEGRELYIYEPLIDDNYFMDIQVFKNFCQFEQHVDLIVANRLEKVLKSCSKEVFTRDLFQRN